MFCQERLSLECGVASSTVKRYSMHTIEMSSVVLLVWGSKFARRRRRVLDPMDRIPSRSTARSRMMLPARVALVVWACELSRRFQ
jgi:hypothetical protein